MPAQAINSVSRVFEKSPTEEELVRTTLWPEIEKIYGHGYEVSSLIKREYKLNFSSLR